MSATAKKTKKTKDSPQGDFHIVDDAGDSSVRWVGICINNREGVEDYLREHDALDPYLLVVVTQNGVEVVRAFEPLQRGLVHIALPRAGTFKLRAAIVYEENNNSRRLKTLFKYTGSDGSYACDLVDFYGGLHHYFAANCGNPDDRHVVMRHDHVAEATIVVGTDNFARERAQWRVNLVKLFFKGNGDNECNWRKRWLGSLALVVFWLPLQYLIKAVGVILFSLAGFVYGLEFKLLLKPGRYGSILNTFGGVNKHSALWFKRKSHFGYEARSGYWILATILVPLWLGLSTVISLEDKLSFVEAMLAAFLSLLFLAIFLGVAIGAGALFKYTRDRMSSAEHKAKIKAKREARDKARNERLQRNDLSGQLKTLSCTETGQPMTVNRLISRRKNDPVIIWNKTKDVVCRPFQQH